MSVALSFVGGTGSFAFLKMICVLKKWFSFWLAVGSHSLRPALAPLMIYLFYGCANPPILAICWARRGNYWL